VVVGLAPDALTYDRLNLAFRLLAKKALLVATHRGRTFRASDGGLSLGPGPFVELLERAAQCTSICVGKPSQTYFSSALEHVERDLKTSILPSECVMVGDDWEDDCLGAKEFGMQSCLVLSGKTERRSTGGAENVLVVNDFAEFVRWVVSGSAALL
jgi:HAD superfamily hydrolase (TIGR01450 family)